MIAVPESFLTFSRAVHEGDAGLAWAARLPRLVVDLCARWSLTVDGSPMHGYNGLAVPVRQDSPEAEPAILKVSWVGDDTAHEALALSLWDGDGAARLLASDTAVGALLLERLDSTTLLRDRPAGEGLAVAGRLLRRLAVPAPLGSDLVRVSTIARGLAEDLPGRNAAIGHPVSDRVVDATTSMAAELSRIEADVLVDHDLHGENVLRGEREPWLAIDPKVAVGVPEFAVGPLLWTRFDELVNGPTSDLRRNLAWALDLLVEAAHLDREVARAWAVVECVDYWAWGLAAGFTQDPIRCRAIVEQLLF